MINSSCWTFFFCFVALENDDETHDCCCLPASHHSLEFPIRKWSRPEIPEIPQSLLPKANIIDNEKKKYINYAGPLPRRTSHPLRNINRWNCWFQTNSIQMFIMFMMHTFAYISRLSVSVCERCICLSNVHCALFMLILLHIFKLHKYSLIDGN